eukprot:COSAG02_NODE_450_length_22075_cov_13.896888_2_plen_73_part_00
MNHLRAEVRAPLAGYKSACVDIAMGILTRIDSGKCDVSAVLGKINQVSMWMVPAEEIACEVVAWAMGRQPRI